MYITRRPFTSFNTCVALAISRPLSSSTLELCVYVDANLTGDSIHRQSTIDFYVFLGDNDLLEKQDVTQWYRGELLCIIHDCCEVFGFTCIHSTGLLHCIEIAKVCFKLLAIRVPISERSTLVSVHTSIISTTMMTLFPSHVQPYVDHRLLYQDPYTLTLCLIFGQTLGI